MKCTAYARGLMLTNEDLKEVKQNLRKEYPQTSDKELDALGREAIVLHNRAINIDMRLGSGSVEYYENGNSDRQSTLIDRVNIDAKGNITFYTVDGDIDLHFKEVGSRVVGNVQSDVIENAIKNSPRHEDDLDTLFNVDMDEDAMNKMFGSSENVMSGNLKQIHAEMVSIDEKAPNVVQDTEHTEHLRKLTKRMYRLVKEIGALKIDVSKSMLNVLSEPAASFNPNVKGSKVRILPSDLAEKANNRFLMGNEEALVHEITHAYLDVLFHKSLGVLGQDVKDDLRRLYTVAKSRMTYKDLLPEGEGPYTKEETAKAKSMYDYIFTGKLDDFTNKDADRRLQEFIVYGLTNKHVKKALQNTPLEYRKIKVPDSASWLSKTFYGLLNKLNKLVFDLTHMRNRGKDIETELLRLSIALGEVNNKYGNKAKEHIGIVIDEKFNEGLDKVSKEVDKAVKEVVDNVLERFSVIDNKTDKHKYKEAELTRVHKLLTYINKEAELARNSGVLGKTWHIAKMFPAITRLYTIIGDYNSDEYLKIRIQLDYLLKKMYGKYYEFLKDLIADFTAGRKTLVQITDITMKFKSHLDRMRDMHFKGALRDIQTGFKNIDMYANKNLKYNHALNRVIMRTDFQAVSTDAKVLRKYLTDSNILDKEINKLEKSIKSIKHGNYVLGNAMVRNAKSVAKYMLTKKGLRSNAHNIARNFGSVLAFPDGGELVAEYNVVKIENMIDRLITLYALKDIDSEYKERMVELIDLDVEGVTNYLVNSKGVQVATKSDWELNGKLQEMVKGQMKENTDYSKELIFAPFDKATSNKMENLGYRLIRTMRKDSGDTGKMLYGLYVNDNVGLTKRVDGAIGLQRLTIKGLTLSEKVRVENEHLSNERINNKIREAIRHAAKHSNYNNMYPIYNEYGRVIDFRYEPTLSEMETHIDLEKRGTDLLARSFGQKDTQVYTDTNNEELIDIIIRDTKETLKSIKDENLAKELLDNEFIRVYATENRLTTAELKGKVGEADVARFMPKTEGEELWGLLPPKTRAYIVEMNKKEDLAKGVKNPKERREIYIRKDLMKQLFGYNQAMVSNSSLIKRLPLSIQHKVRLIEQGFADIIAIAKSMVVIKLPRTIIGNIVSNAKFLWFSGMPINKAVKYLLISKRNLDKWKEDEKKRRNLERKVDMLEGAERDKVRKKLADLAAEIKDNPLIPLLEEGLYQTIVEDINLEEDSNKIVNWVEKKLEDSVIGNNKTIKEVVNTAFLTRKSALGQLLLHVTQESDFHFRAAIYWNAIENGVSKEKALREVTDNFINYSKVINSKVVQWLDKMGPEAFWKYFANIQRVNLKLLKTNTTKVVMDSLGKKYLDIPNDVLDSSIIFRWGKRLNPFSWLDNTESLISGAADVPITHLIDGY